MVIRQRRAGGRYWWPGPGGWQMQPAGGCRGRGAGRDNVLVKLVLHDGDVLAWMTAADAVRWAGEAVDAHHRSELVWEQSALARYPHPAPAESPCSSRWGWPEPKPSSSTGWPPPSTPSADSRSGRGPRGATWPKRQPRPACRAMAMPALAQTMPVVVWSWVTKVSIAGALGAAGTWCFPGGPAPWWPMAWRLQVSPAPPVARPSGPQYSDQPGQQCPPQFGRLISAGFSLGRLLAGHPRPAPGSTSAWQARLRGVCAHPMAACWRQRRSPPVRRVLRPDLGDYPDRAHAIPADGVVIDVPPLHLSRGGACGRSGGGSVR